jgi:MFS family permease
LQNWRIILLFTLFPILSLAWLAIQILNPETATVPMRILTQRTIAAAFLYTFSSQASMLVITYYIPLFFQAIKNFSPISSGLATLPSILALVFGIIMAGGMVQKFGYPAPFMIASAILSSTGAGLITTWQMDVGKSMWIGYQVLVGFGTGMGMQQPSMTAQIVLPKADAPTGVSLMFFGQNLGGAIFISVAQNLFTDALASQLSTIPGLEIDKGMVVRLGATKIKEMVLKELLGVVLEAYRVAIRNAFYLGLGLAAFSMLGAVAVEWRSVKEEEKADEITTSVEKVDEKIV